MTISVCRPHVVPSRWLAVTAIVLLPLAADARTVDPTPALDDAFLEITFEEARTRARVEGKLVMIDFYTTWCAPCRRMDQGTFRDPKVTAWLRAKTVPIRVDADHDAALKGRYRVNQYPTFVFTNPVGHQRARLVGYRDAETFLSEVKTALTGVDALGRARTRFLAAQDDFRRRLTLARALVRAEQYAEALEHYLWCLDHRGEASAGRTDTVLTGVLADIAHLGKRFPPARTELIRRRDQLAAAIILDPGSDPGTEQGGEPGTLTDQIRDLVAIDRDGLGEPNRTLALYDRLVTMGKQGPQEVRSALGEALRPALLIAGRYPDVARDLGDPAAVFNQALAAHRSRTAQAVDLPAALRAQASTVQRETLVALGLDIYEVLSGTKARADAKRIAKQILALDPAPPTRAALVARANHAGARKAASALAAGG